MSEASCFDDNVDYSGGDLPGTPVTVKSVPECQDLCRKEPECQSFTVEKTEDSRRHTVMYKTRNCWLKYGEGAWKWIAERRRISGYKTC